LFGRPDLDIGRDYGARVDNRHIANDHAFKQDSATFDIALFEHNRAAQFGPLANVGIAIDQGAVDIGARIDNRIVANHRRAVHNHAAFDFGAVAEVDRAVQSSVGRNIGVAVDPDAAADVLAHTRQIDFARHVVATGAHIL